MSRDRTTPAERVLAALARLQDQVGQTRAEADLAELVAAMAADTLAADLDLRQEIAFRDAEIERLRDTLHRAGLGTHPAEVTPSYRITVERRAPSDRGYETDPYCAAAWLGERCVAVQFGSQPGSAFQKAWLFVQRDREREPVDGEVCQAGA